MTESLFDMSMNITRKLCSCVLSSILSDVYMTTVKRLEVLVVFVTLHVDCRVASLNIVCVYRVDREQDH